MGKVAAGLLIFRRFALINEYLLLQTSYGIHHWTPPKGHVDKGETDLMVTALRETEEESGLIQRDLEIYKDCRKVLKYNANGKPKEVHYYLAELVNPKAKVRLSDEHQDYKWLPLSDACDLVGYEELQLTLTEFDQFITKNLNNLGCAC